MKKIMKKTALAVCGLVVGITFVCGAASAGDDKQLTEEKDKISYSVGFQIGGDMKRQEVELDPEALLQGINDAMKGAEPAMSQAQMRETLIALKKKVMEQQQKQQQVAAEKNLKEGEAFLAANKDKEGVVTLPSGLQYKVLSEGTGDKPAATDTVTVHYKGTLLDGTEFDSSYSRNQPAKFPLNQVIKGWTEGVQLMKKGAKWRLFVPADLAYGERGAGGRIGPNATLIFDVELLDIEKN